MRKSLLLAVLAAFGLVGFAQTEVVNANMDGWYRTDNSSVTYDLASDKHIELVHGTKNDADVDFYGLLSFSIPEKEGYRLASAQLRFVSKMIKTTRATGFYKIDAKVADKPKFDEITPSITAALATEPIGQINAEGNNGKQVTSDKDIAEKYQTIDKWVNNIELSVSKITTGQDLNLLVAINGDRAANSNNNRFFGKNAADFTNPNYETLTATNADICPQLTLIYEEDTDSKNVTVLPTADTFLRKGKTDNNGGKTFIEVENTSDGATDFVGLISFTVPAEDGMEVTKATLRLTTKRVKQSRATVSLYDYTGEWAENAKYEDQEANVTAARATTVLATFTPEGQLNKDVSSDEITTEKYQVINGWQNNIDLTEFVKGLSTSSFSIMIDANADKGQLQFFSKEATTFENAKTAISNADTDLVPQLTVTLSKKGDPTGIQTVETKTINIQEGVYTLGGQRVEKMVRGIYIINGKKVVIK